jgi:hypothetical protein
MARFVPEPWDDDVSEEERKTMKMIWKFPLRDMGPCEVPMPQGAEILDVQMQNELPCIWAMVDPHAPVEAKTFVIHGTGHVVGDDTKLSYIGTVQQGTLVWHVFEVMR